MNVNASTITLAFVRREIRAAMASRLALLVPLAGLAAGAGASLSSAPQDLPLAAPLFLLQILLYGLPLAATLAAVGSAHAESGEGLLLATLPGSRLPRAIGKFSALLACFALATALAVALPACLGLDLASAAALFGYGIGASSCFLALGLLVGFTIRDGVKAHLAALGVWILLTLGASLFSYLLLPGASNGPMLWALLMMLSPLDALRVGILFSIEPVPFDTASTPGLARWWLTHPGLWFSALATCFTLFGLIGAGRSLRRA